jgi:uncharacterized membrane protein YedE/YeeE
MTDPTAFLPALAGGVLIGIAIALLLLLNGRIAGISGVLGGLVRPEPGEWSWRALFIAGLVAGGCVARAVTPGALGTMQASVPMLAVAGLLVGFGTRLSGGCTSGHGVCGTSRLSLRSITATGTFMLLGAAAVLVVRHGMAR